MNEKQESHGKHGNDESHASHASDQPQGSEADRLLPPRGDYQTLRVRDLVLWHKDSKEALFVRALGRRTPQTFEVNREYVETRPAEVIANIAICLIHQTNYLLDQQLKTLEKEFVEQGGLRERMTKARLNYRNQHPGQ